MLFIARNIFGSRIVAADTVLVEFCGRFWWAVSSDCNIGSSRWSPGCGSCCNKEPFWWLKKYCSIWMVTINADSCSIRRFVWTRSLCKTVSMMVSIIFVMIGSISIWWHHKWNVVRITWTTNCGFLVHASTGVVLYSTSSSNNVWTRSFPHLVWKRVPFRDISYHK